MIRSISHKIASPIYLLLIPFLFLSSATRGHTQGIPASTNIQSSRTQINPGRSNQPGDLGLRVSPNRGNVECLPPSVRADLVNRRVLTSDQLRFIRTCSGRDDARTQDSIRVAWNSTANLSFLNNSRINVGTLTIGPDRSSSYTFPCTVSGQGAARYGVKKDGSSCRAMRVTQSPPRSPIGAGLSSSIDRIASSSSGAAGRSLSKSSSLENIIKFNDIKLIAQVPTQNSLYHCSAVAETGTDWGIGFSESGGDLFSSNDACNQALIECEDKGADCLIVDLGEWRANEQSPISPSVTTALKCEDNTSGTLYPGNHKDNIPYNRVLQGSQISLSSVMNLATELETKARQELATGCSLSIFNNDEVIVSPFTSLASDDQSVFRFDTPENGPIVITPAYGDVVVTSASRPGGVLVELGQSYTYYPERSQDKDEFGSVNLVNLTKIRDSDPVRGLLDPNQWTDPAIKDNLFKFSNDVKIHIPPF